MATIVIDRYASAVHARSLVVDERTTYSDSDVLGAMGLAAKHLAAGWVTTGPEEGYPIREAPLAVPLQRLLAGDNRAAHEIVGILAGMVWGKAERERVKPKLTRVMAHDMACGCLAWHRHGTCTSCRGHGYDLIPGAPMLSERECKPCHGTGKIPFEDQFKDEHVDLARWLLAEMERALGRAGPAAMATIAPRLDF
jgi:hypothetical protein